MLSSTHAQVKRCSGRWTSLVVIAAGVLGHPRGHLLTEIKSWELHGGDEQV